MSAPPAPRLLLVPGPHVVLFLLCTGNPWPLLCVHATRWLEGLRAARAALSFTGVQREEPALDELLPWAGNV